MQQAYQDQLTELYSQYSAVLIEAEENSIGLTKAQYSLEAAQQKLSDTYAQMDALWADAQKQADAYYDQYGLLHRCDRFSLAGILRPAKLHLRHQQRDMGG